VAIGDDGELGAVAAGGTEVPGVDGVDVWANEAAVIKLTTAALNSIVFIMSCPPELIRVPFGLLSQPRLHAKRRARVEVPDLRGTLKPTASGRPFMNMNVARPMALENHTSQWLAGRVAQGSPQHDAPALNLLVQKVLAAAAGTATDGIG
jgi:hypothetical protein